MTMRVGLQQFQSFLIPTESITNFLNELTSGCAQTQFMSPMKTLGTIPENHFLHWGCL